MKPARKHKSPVKLRGADISNPGPRFHTGLTAAALVVMTLLAYGPVYTAGFVWDDHPALHNNPLLQIPGGLGLIWTTVGRIPNESHYWPIVYTFYWLEVRLWGFNPLGFHVVNVVVHTANTLLLFALVRRIRLPGAWLAGAIFALHPVHVESVAWIHEFKDVISALFYLGAFHAFLSYERRGDPMWLGLTCILFIAGMLSKTVVVTLPVALVIWVWYRHDGPVRYLLRRWRPIIPLLAIAVAMALIDIAVARRLESVEFGFSVIDRVLLIGRSFWFYAGKLLWPAGLTAIYPKWPIDAGAPLQYLFPLAAVGLVVVLWLYRGRIGRGPLAAILFYGVTLSPMLGVVDFSFMEIAYVADRFQYLASIGPILLIAALAGHYVLRLPKYRRHSFVAFMILLFVLGGLTWRQASLYKDIETLFRQALEHNPKSPVIHNNLGAALQEQGDLEAARTHFTQALALWPEYATAHNNLGLVMVRKGQYEQAIDQYRQALRHGSFMTRTANDLAWLLATQPDPSEPELEEALHLATQAAEQTEYRHPSILDTLAAVYAASGQYDRATRLAVRARLMAQAMGDEALARDIENRLTRYRQGKTATRE